VCTSLTCTCTTQTLNESYIDVVYVTPTCENITKISKECQVINIEIQKEQKRIITCNQEYINSILIPELFWCDPRIDGNILIPNRTDLFVIASFRSPIPLDHKCGENVRQKIVMLLQGCN